MPKLKKFRPKQKQLINALQVVVVFAVLGGIYLLFGTRAATILPPYVEGNKLYHGNLDSGGNKRRFIIEGTNIEFLRYSDGCTQWEESNIYSQRAQLAQYYRQIGINAVRINIGNAAYGSQSQINRLVDLVQAFADQGIYSMPSTHNYTGSDLSGYTGALPIFNSIISAVEAGIMAHDLIKATTVDTS